MGGSFPNDAFGGAAGVGKTNSFTKESVFIRIKIPIIIPKIIAAHLTASINSLLNLLKVVGIY